MSIFKKLSGLLAGIAVMACQCSCPPPVVANVPANCASKVQVCLYDNSGYDEEYMLTFSGDDPDYSNNVFSFDGAWEIGTLVDSPGHGVSSLANNTDSWVVFFWDAHRTRPTSASVDLAVACVAPRRSIPNLNEASGGIFGLGGPNDEASSHYRYSRSELDQFRFTCQYRIDEAGVTTYKTIS